MHNGDVRIVTGDGRCRPGELDLALSGDAASIYDANNVRVGPVISTRSHSVDAALTRISLNAQDVFIWVSPTAVGGTATGAADVDGLTFDGPNCTGRPFLFLGGGADALVTPTLVASPGWTVYKAIAPEHPQAIQGLSLLLPDGTCESNVFAEPFGPSFYLEPVGRLDGNFAPPFTVK
jgi:hypothetical protein